MDLQDIKAKAAALSPWAHLATVGADGKPDVVPVHPCWEGDTLWVMGGSASVKARNIAANPNVALHWQVTEAGDGTKHVLVLTFESGDHPLDPWMKRALEICGDFGGEWDKEALEDDLELEQRQLERYRERVQQATDAGFVDVAEALRPLLTQTQEHVRDLQTVLGL